MSPMADSNDRPRDINETLQSHALPTELIGVHLTSAAGGGMTKRHEKSVLYTMSGALVDLLNILHKIL